jgi:hypothetical protein
MSTSPTPITPEQFTRAIHDLPVDTLHAKAAEIQNSINHLRHSNEQMLPFADEGDQDCKEAMFENLTVIGRMNERIELLKREVEGRGLRWSAEGEGDGMNGRVEGDGMNVEVNGNGTATVNSAGGGQQPGPRAPSGRLTDEELRRQVEAQMQMDGDEEEEGVHL